jgi:hypothetical protein
MIEIKLASPEKLVEICTQLNIESNCHLKIYVAYDGAEELGSCGFQIFGKQGSLDFSYMKEENLRMIEDGLLRSALSLMFETGVEVAVCGGGVDPRMLKRLGFQQNGTEYSLTLKDSFLTQGCGC